MSILQRIVEAKRAEVAERQRQTPLSVLRHDSPMRLPCARSLKR